MGIEHIDDLREISERTVQPVDFVDDDDLNLAGLDAFQKPLERRRSIVPPERPPSSYISGSASQPA